MSPAETDGAAGGVGELCAVEFETCPLEAGTYSSAPFEPEFTFTVDDGWINERAWPDGGGISKEIGAVYWASGSTRGIVGGEEVEIAGGVDGFVAFLSSLGTVGMTVSEPTDATVDGASGQQIDVDSNAVEAFGLFQLEADQFNLVPDEKARFLVVDMEGEAVVFILDAFAADDFDEWLTTAEPVMQSIKWAQ